MTSWAWICCSTCLTGSVHADLADRQTAETAAVEHTRLSQSCSRVPVLDAVSHAESCAFICTACFSRALVPDLPLSLSSEAWSRARRPALVSNGALSVERPCSPLCRWLYGPCAAEDLLYRLSQAEIAITNRPLHRRRLAGATFGRPMMHWPDCRRLKTVRSRASCLTELNSSGKRFSA